MQNGGIAIRTGASDSREFVQWSQSRSDLISADALFLPRETSASLLNPAKPEPGKSRMPQQVEPQMADDESTIQSLEFTFHDEQEYKCPDRKG